MQINLLSYLSRIVYMPIYLTVDEVIIHESSNLKPEGRGWKNNAGH